MLTIQPTTVPVDMVAFYAYLSSDIPASIAHHIIAFDTVITNVGNAHHPHSGTFIAPRSGVYVFTWTIRLYGHSYIKTELLVNNNVVNGIYFNPNNYVQGSVSGTFWYTGRFFILTMQNNNLNLTNKCLSVRKVHC